MSIKQIIKESIEKNPVGLKEALEEELRSRLSLALEAKMEEGTGISSMSHSRLKWHMNTGVPHGSYTDDELKDERDRRLKFRDTGEAYKKAKAGLNEDYDQIDEEAGHVKDGYYVTNQSTSEVTHDKPFRDSKSAISHANKGEDKTGYVHRVHKVKSGKIDKQWEYNGGHHDAGWEHFSDFKGDHAHNHMRKIPKHFLHTESMELDEISKDRLGSYIKKAKNDYAGSFDDIHRTVNLDPKDKKRTSAIHRMIKRNFGIDKAVDKLTK